MNDSSEISEENAANPQCNDEAYICIEIDSDSGEFDLYELMELSDSGEIIEENATNPELIDSYEISGENSAHFQIGSGIANVDDDEDDEEEHVHMITKNIRFYKNLNAAGERLVLRFNHPSKVNNADIERWLKCCFDELLYDIKVDLNLDDRDSFSNSCNSKADFNISFRNFNQHSSDSILSAVENLIQSNTHFFLCYQLM